MNKPEMLFYVACLVLIIVPIWFIRHKVYDDGVLGRIALAIIAVCAFAVLGQAGSTYYDAWLTGESYRNAGYHVEWEEAWLCAGFALFITWHLVRFHRRVVRCSRPPLDPTGTWPAAKPIEHGWPADEAQDLEPQRAVRARAR